MVSPVQHLLILCDIFTTELTFEKVCLLHLLLESLH